MNNDENRIIQQAVDKAYKTGYTDGVSEKPRNIDEQLEYRYKHGYIDGLKESEFIVADLKADVKRLMSDLGEATEDRMKRADRESILLTGNRSLQEYIQKDKNRANLEWLVKIALDEAIISISRGRELLGFQYMEEMREWINMAKKVKR